MRNFHMGVLLLIMFCTIPYLGWTQIISDGLNNTSSVFTLSGGAYYSGNTGVSARPVSSSYVYEGLAAFGVASGTATLTSSNINTVGFTDIQLQFKLVSFSDGSSTNGAENTDVVTVEVSPDGGTNWYSTLRVVGNNNACWDYAATGVAVTGYDGDATPITFAASAGGLISDGYSTVFISNLPSIADLQVRINLLNDAPNERWVIDDFKVLGMGVCISTVAPVALDATNVGSTSFTANWNPVTGATGYFVDVYDSVTSSNTIDEGFGAGATAPTGWIFTAIGGTYTSAGNFGNSSPSLQMSATNAQVLTATQPFATTQLSFWIKGQSTDNASALLVEGFNGGSWFTIQNITNSIPISGTTFTYNASTSPSLPPNIVQFRFTYTKSAGNLAFDDVSIIYPTTTFSFVNGFQNIFVNTNSIDVTGLTPGASYSYVVRSFNGECSSTNSNIINNPGAAACAATTTISSFFPATGPVGTMVTITGTGFSNTPITGGVKFGEVASTNYIISSNTSILAEVPTGTTATCSIKVANAGSCWNSSAGNFSLISKVGSCTMSDLIISEVYDPGSGNNHYIEIFNGTSSTVNLNIPNNYTIQVWNNPGTTTTFDISGSIVSGQVKVYYAGTNGGLATAPAQGVGVGFNEDDEIRLLKNGTVIDRMVAPNNTGFNWRRMNSVSGPNSIYTASEWSLKQETDASLSQFDIGFFTTSSNIDFSVHPVDQSCSFSMNVVPVGIYTAYQWLFFDPFDSTWKNVTLAALPGTTQSGASTNNLIIGGDLTPYLNYQFYLEVRNGTLCSSASNAAQFSYDTKAYYKANVASGNWTTPGSWLMSDNLSSGYSATCTYPVAANSQVVIIPANTKINHSTNLSISIDYLAIENVGELEIGATAGLKILNSVTGEDLLIDGTLLDKSGPGAGNGLAFEDNSGTANDAGWKFGSTGTIIKTAGSSASAYRDFYHTGISNIPPGANWIYRYDNSLTASIGFVSSTSTTVMCYPNLTVENTVSGNTYSSGFNSGAPNLSTFTMTGLNNPIYIKGNFNVGGSGPGFINFLNINSNSTIKVEGDLTVTTGSTLHNFGNATNVGTGFEIKGNLVVNGIFTTNGGPTNTGMLRFAGATQQTISGTGTMNLEDVDINNGMGANVVLNKNVDIPGTLSFGVSGKLNLNTGNITLQSSIERTANVGAIPSMNAITYSTGKFVVERYISTGTIHPRSWQFLATPTIGQSIFHSWQESGNNSIVGYGTQITGPVVATGIDSETFAPSLKTYNSTTNLWEAVSNTTVPVYNPKGYMLFVRGDRTSIVTPIYQPPAVPTVLRTAGTIHQPSAAPGTVSVLANQFASVGNPYPSPISLEYIFGNTANSLYLSASVWDPSMYGYYAVGGYQTISSTLNYMPLPGGTSLYPAGTACKDIQSGQAFFVQAMGSTGTMSFSENVKSNTDKLVNFAPGDSGRSPTVSSFATDAIPHNKQVFRTSLHTSTGIIADGNGVAFAPRYENSIDKYDANKVSNSGENFGMSRNGHWLAVEARSMIKKTDTIFYSMYNLKRADYQLRFAPENMQQGNLTAYLVDNYLNNRTQLSLTDSNFVDISINGDVASAKPDRFYVVFVPKKTVKPTLPHTKTAESDLITGLEKRRVF